MNKLLEVKDLSKKYSNGVVAVDNVSFEIREGEFFSFLGQNGAGKSTTINIISTLLSQTSGSIVLDGAVVGKHDEQVREKIGIVFQESVLDNLLTVRENLILKGMLYNKPKSEVKVRVEEILKDLEIEYGDQRYGQLSGGQRRRADIARALLNKPKLLILDEPTTGLDPHTRELVWKSIKRLQEKDGITILLTTHYMEETLESDYVVIINKGKICVTGTPEELRNKYSKDKVKFYPKNFEEFKQVLTNDGVVFTAGRDILTTTVENSIVALDLLNKYKDSLINFEVVAGNMDDVFVTVTGETLEGGKAHE